MNVCLVFISLTCEVQRISLKQFVFRGKWRFQSFIYFLLKKAALKIEKPYLFWSSTSRGYNSEKEIFWLGLYGLMLGKKNKMMVYLIQQGCLQTIVKLWHSTILLTKSKTITGSWWGYQWLVVCTGMWQSSKLENPFTVLSRLGGLKRHKRQIWQVNIPCHRAVPAFTLK